MRGLSANWTRSNFGAGVSPPAAAAAGAVGSTGQRWADYDAAKAAEQALRQVLGVPNTDGSWYVGPCLGCGRLSALQKVGWLTGAARAGRPG